MPLEDTVRKLTVCGGNHTSDLLPKRVVRTLNKGNTACTADLWGARVRVFGGGPEIPSEKVGGSSTETQQHTSRAREWDGFWVVIWEETGITAAMATVPSAFRMWDLCHISLSSSSTPASPHSTGQTGASELQRASRLEQSSCRLLRTEFPTVNVGRNPGVVCLLALDPSLPLKSA